MPNSDFRLKFLVIEDDPEFLELLPKHIVHESEKLGILAIVMTAVTTKSAMESAKSQLFHGISIDQRMPEEEGGQTETPKGVELIKHLGRRRLPGFLCAYTGAPDINVSNTAGSLGGIPYKIKSSKTSVDDERWPTMDGVDYCGYLVNSTVDQFIPRVLQIVERSGFMKLHNIAANTRELYEIFALNKFSSDKEAKEFFDSFSKFREHFNRSFAAFTYGLAQSVGQKLATPRHEMGAKEVEDWIVKAWAKIGKNDGLKQDYSAIATFLQLESEANVGKYFVDASSELRGPRNAAVHDDWEFAPEDFLKLRGAFFRYCDCVALLAGLPLVVQPRLLRNNYLTFTDINRSRAKDGEIFYQSGLPPTIPTRVFAMLPNSTRLIGLDGGLTAERDPETNRLRIKQEVFL